MSIRKQILQPQTLRHFKLPGNPFDEVASSDEFYANEQLRYTRAQLLDACKRGGFVAVVGESGSGKTTLRRDLQERVQRADMPIQIIRPTLSAWRPTTPRKDAQGQRDPGRDHGHHRPA